MSNTSRYMILLMVGDTGGKIWWPDYGPCALKHRHMRDRDGDGNRAWRRVVCRLPEIPTLVDRSANGNLGGRVLGRR